MDKAVKMKAQLLLDRLERISADSPWAHQASGIRAALAKQLWGKTPDIRVIEGLIESGFQILENAAGEIPDDAHPEISS
jgi:hypothetical protein